MVDGFDQLARSQRQRIQPVFIGHHFADAVEQRIGCLVGFGNVQPGVGRILDKYIRAIAGSEHADVAGRDIAAKVRHDA